MAQFWDLLGKNGFSKEAHRNPSYCSKEKVNVFQFLKGISHKNRTSEEARVFINVTCLS